MRNGQALAWVLGVVCVCGVRGGPACQGDAVASPAGAEEVRFREGFEEGMAAWRQVGEADFAVDENAPYSGVGCARISVAAGATLAYQHLERVFRPVAYGDEFRVTLEVRTAGVTDGSGAYAALEFLDKDGQRAGIAHSEVNNKTGASGWQFLVIEGRATMDTCAASLHLLLHAHGTAWFDDIEVLQTGRLSPLPDLGAAVRKVTVHTGEVIHPCFGGVGFHVFYHAFPASQEYMDTVLTKRWRELNPSFARLNDQPDWDRAMRDRVAAHLLRLKEDTGTEVYLTTWGPQDTQAGKERAAYARQVADALAYWVQDKGATNITTYCMTNELSLGAWGSLINDLPKFRNYHQELFKAFHERGLDIALLATDASPLQRWHTIAWAAEHMDDITGVYGGHHYISEYDLEDLHFYPWFLSRLEWGVGIARQKGKNFILGEFGCKQDGRVVEGIKRDTCIYWDTPREPLVAIQLAEAVIASLNAGVYAMGYWTFADFPDDYNPHYINKWGLFRRSGEDNATRAHYYGYGLLTKFFRGPATVLKAETNDPHVRAAAVRHHGTDTVSVALVNRYPGPIEVALSFDGDVGTRPFRRYVYDPEKVPYHPFGDLPPHTGVTVLDEGVLNDRVGPNTLTVYTSAYDETPPAPVRGLTVKHTEKGVALAWEPSPEPDFCYYRVYRAGAQSPRPMVDNQIVSTLATQYLDTATASTQDYSYAVVAVDLSGNTGDVIATPVLP